jgi:ribonuclease-3
MNAGCGNHGLLQRSRVIKLSQHHHQNLLEALGVSFSRMELFYEALTHRSVLTDGVSWEEVRDYLEQHHISLKPCSYERLEFLGDSVLGLLVTERLIQRDENFPEGILSKLRSKIVCEQMLASVARRYDLGSFLFMGKGAEEARHLDSILADGIEALIGAAYMEGGLPKASDLFDRFLGEVLSGDLRVFLEGDYKTRLQEWTQKHYKATPTYQLIQSVGPEHQKTFEVIVRIGSQVLGRGEGSSKKRASQMAAFEAHNRLVALDRSENLEEL